MRTRLRIVAIWIICAACFLGGVFYTGHLVASTNLGRVFPFSYADATSKRATILLRKLYGSLRAGEAEKSTASREVFYSTFVALQGQRVSVPKSDRAGAGGGLTTIGDDLVVLRFDGVLFYVGQDKAVHALDIDTPDNGFKAYYRDSTEGRLQHLTHIFNFFRYNDVLYLTDDKSARLVLSYTYYDEARQCYFTRVSQLVFDAPISRISTISANRSDWEVVFDTKPCLLVKKEWRAIEGHMAGGRIASNEFNTLYLASGDYALDGVYGPRTLGKGRPAVAQDPLADYGKVIRIDLNSGKGTQISVGHRNTQGVAVDARGQLWVVEHGNRGGDELNLIRENANFGWPNVSYGTLYSALPIPDLEVQGFHSGYERPKLAFLPSIAVSSLMGVDDFHETWNGDLLAGTLRGQVLVRFRIVGNEVVFSEFIKIGERIRYVQQHVNGEIALWLDSNEVLFLKPRTGGQSWQYIDYRLRTDDLSQGIKTAVRQTITQCAECHSLTAGDDQNSPSLAKVYGRKIGSTGYEGYSSAMRNDGRQWTEANLRAYLKNPDRFIAGTAMPNPNLPDEVLSPLISILRGLAEAAEIPPQFR